MRIRDWSSDVCSSDLAVLVPKVDREVVEHLVHRRHQVFRNIAAIAVQNLDRPGPTGRERGVELVVILVQTGLVEVHALDLGEPDFLAGHREIGSASYREGDCRYG